MNRKHTKAKLVLQRITIELDKRDMEAISNRCLGTQHDCIRVTKRPLREITRKGRKHLTERREVSL